jgi:hypothetical protein
MMPRGALYDVRHINEVLWVYILAGGNEKSYTLEWLLTWSSQPKAAEMPLPISGFINKTHFDFDKKMTLVRVAQVLNSGFGGIVFYVFS